MKRFIILLLFSFILFKGKAQLNFNPNPFTTSTAITYSIPSTGTVSLYVYNINGVHVQTLMNDSLINAGTYSFNYTALGLPQGQYNFGLITSDTSFFARAFYMGGGVALGIDKVVDDSSPLIYPNPTSKTLSINYTGFKKINIIDLNGKTIKTIFTSDNTISISDINTGNYIVNVYSEQNQLITTQKVFKSE